MTGNGNAPKLSEPFAAPEFFVNGFGNYRKMDGLIFCSGYRVLSDGEAPIVVHLIFPARVLEEIIALARNAREVVDPRTDDAEFVKMH